MTGAQQGFQWPSPGAQDVPSYLMAGLPWVSSSAIPSGSTWTINFPYVTSQLTIHNAGLAGSSNMAVGFTLSGSQGNNRFILSNNTNVADTFSEHVRVKTVYITALTNFCTASVFAGLTVIPANRFPTLTGSQPATTNTGSAFFGSSIGPLFSYPDGSGLG